MKILEKEKGLIASNFRLAKDKANQIIVEAELHGCDVGDIKDILGERGFEVSQYKFTRATAGFWMVSSGDGKHKHSDQITELYNKGLNNRQIAKVIGVSAGTVGRVKRLIGLDT